jgi:glutamyl-tRNA reductase
VNLLVVGSSHHTAALALLERLAVPGGETPAMLRALVAQQCVNEAVVLSTCNRVEVYASVTAFHGGLTEIGEVLAERAGMDLPGVTPHLYVHHHADAVRHAMRVASGLDSMVVGETQILGQLREAYAVAAETETAGRLLHELMQQALRVGKRVHSETDLSRAGQNVVSAALAVADAQIADSTALVVGAGSIGALALGTLRRRGAAGLLVANRSLARAQKLALLHGATAIGLSDLSAALSTVDLVLCATASDQPVISQRMVQRAISTGPAGRIMTIIDLAIPRDVAPEVAGVPGVRLVDLASIGSEVAVSASGRDAVEAIVAAEAEAFLTWLRGAEVAPTVAALRARAEDLIAAELQRLAQRQPDLTPAQRAAVAHTVHRVVQRLLHPPTVRVRQLATTAGGDQYAIALRELFDLPSDEKNLDRAVDVERGEVTPG